MFDDKFTLFMNAKLVLSACCRILIVFADIRKIFISLQSILFGFLSAAEYDIVCKTLNLECF